MPAILMKTKKRLVLDLRTLNLLALKFIFDKFHVNATDERFLEDSIEAWSKKVDLTKDERKELQAVVNCLLMDKQGYFDSEKYAYNRADIDYRKVYSEGI